MPDIPRGTWPRLREGGDLTLAAHGMGVGLAVQAAEVLASEHGISADVYDGGYLKPFDEAAIVDTAARTGKVLTIEDHTVNGGIGAIVAETVAGTRSSRTSRSARCRTWTSRWACPPNCMSTTG